MRALWNWLRRSQLEAELQRELSYHLQRRIGDLEQQGFTTEDAARKAHAELQGVARVQEEVRDVWLSRWLRDLFYDLRFSLRAFRRTPAFAASAMISIALGIGATTAIYSLVDQLLVHGLPVREPERLVLFDWHGENASEGFGSSNLLSYPICRDLDKQKQFFEGVFCRALTTVNLSTAADRPEETEAEVVSGNYFRVLGVTAAVGRVFANSDDGAPNSNPEIVLSYGFWKGHMGGAQVIGSKVLVNQHPMTVIGVAAPSFQGIDVGEVPAFWVPASVSEAVYPGFRDYLSPRTVWVQVLGRLQPSVSARQAQTGLQLWFKAMLDEDTRRPGFPPLTAETRREYFRSKLGLTAAPQGHSTLRQSLSEPLWVLFGVTVALLGLACLNVAGLFLARGSAREREISTRVALGASSGRVGRQLLADSLLVAIAGGLLGTAVAPVMVRGLLTFLPRNPAANALHSGLDGRLFLFAFATTLTVGVLSGLAPAWQAQRRTVASSLRDRTGIAGGGVQLRKMIVTAQMALTLVLLFGAALFIRTLNGLMTRGPGFSTESTVSFSLNPARNGYSAAAAKRVMQQMDDSVRNAPITQAAGLANFTLLIGGSRNNSMTIQGKERVRTDRSVNLNSVTPTLFKTLGIKMRMGRNFDGRDEQPFGASGIRAAVVNEAFAKRYAGGRNPIGMLICIGAGPDAKPNIPIVGVASDFAYRNMRENSEQAFFPYFGDGSSAGTFYAKVRGTPDQALRTFRERLRRIDPALPMSGFTTLEEQVRQSLNTEHLLATLSVCFGAVALLLSAVGLYGVMAFVVTQRFREIGVRVALGARRGSTVRLILWDAAVMVFWGIAIGTPVAWFLARIVASELFGVKPYDPTVVAAAVIVLILAAMSAAFIPARRAASVDPMEALRSD